MTLARERVVYAFPHAGASAARYRDWTDRVGDGSRLVFRPMELPGRGRLVREPAVHDLPTLARRLAADIHADWSARPRGVARDWVTFGHSFGGVLSVIVTHDLAERYGMRPEFSLVSCSVPPCRQPEDNRHEWSDTRILQQAAADGATPAALLNEPVMARQVLFQIRADYAIRHQFLAHSDLAVHQPLRLIAANGDEHVPVETVRAWRHHTRAGAELVRIDGDHFAVYQHFTLVCRELVRTHRQTTPV